MKLENRVVAPSRMSLFPCSTLSKGTSEVAVVWSHGAQDPSLVRGSHQGTPASTSVCNWPDISPAEIRDLHCRKNFDNLISSLAKAPVVLEVTRGLVDWQNREGACTTPTQRHDGISFPSPRELASNVQERYSSGLKHRSGTHGGRSFVSASVPLEHASGSVISGYMQKKIPNDT
jgi:hypothetical protein